jgi:hypothetical protein
MPGDAGIEDEEILYAYRIAGAHNGGDIMRIEDVLQYDDDVLLSFVQHAGDPVFPLRSHNHKVSSKACTGNRNM